ncbi:MAG: type VI secretion system tube protein Hcp, partial [Opitutales bacterium]
MPSLSRTALSLLFASFTAEVAATRAYLRIDDIEGEAQTPGFRDWIEIERYTPGLPRGEEAVTGTGSNRPVRHGPFIIRKALDRASPFLAAAAVRQRRFAEVEIQHPAADTTAGALLAHFRLHDVRLEEVSLATPPA